MINTQLIPSWVTYDHMTCNWVTWLPPLGHMTPRLSHITPTTGSHDPRLSHMTPTTGSHDFVKRIQTWLLRSFFSPLRTCSYASSLRPIQFRMRPFIACVSAETKSEQATNSLVELAAVWDLWKTHLLPTCGLLLLSSLPTPSTPWLSTLSTDIYASTLTS